MNRFDTRDLAVSVEARIQVGSSEKSVFNKFGGRTAAFCGLRVASNDVHAHFRSWILVLWKRA